MMFGLINEPEKKQHGDESQWFIWWNTRYIQTQDASVANVPKSHSPIKYVINVFPNVRSQAQELAIDAMKSGL